jgi:uncharacterized protein (DUF1684 family)
MAVPADPLSLAHWRRSVAEMYAAVRQAAPADRLRAWEEFRAQRAELFKTHPQSPLSAEQRAGFTGFDYFPYRPDWRLFGRLERDVAQASFSVDLGADGHFSYTQVALVHFTAAGQPAALSLFWIEGYGGGLFLPFRDGSCGRDSYGGGRYLYDTIKGADLGTEAGELVLDFNYAYNPSCAYHERWVCPLSPPENRLPFAIEAGEKVFRG